MYFHSRMQAGRMLAAQLTPKYRYENCAVVALNDGGVVVGAQIASALHCVLTMLLINEITLPREINSIGGMTQDGGFTYNSALSSGEVDELSSEYRGFIEQEKITRLHEMNRLVGSVGLIKPELLRGHNVILATDGLNSPFALDLAANFLKPIRIDRLIVATPLASVPAVDRMHIVADEICCLDVLENFMEVDHYYDKQDVPSHDKVIKIIEDVVLHWK